MNTLGTTAAGDALDIDLQSLIESRLLLVANSGGGKSWLIRRLLEQTHGEVQHIVLDVEGEFHTLREKFDYILARPIDGDCVAHPTTAKLLAHKLLELGVSAIVDIYELKVHERMLFTRRFLDALVNAPKKLWHPALIVVDEAHVFAPEKGKAESAGPVIDLMTRGRKRGFCGVLATQRIAKLHKDAAAEANNKLIGRCNLDIDMRRAADELGFAGRDQQHQLRTLAPGEFFAFGPALSPAVERMTVGPVETTHPRAGERAIEPPPPSDSVRQALEQLAELPQEAEQEARDVADLKKENARLKAEVTRSRNTSAPDADALAAAERRGYERGRAEADGIAKALETDLRRLKAVAHGHGDTLRKLGEELDAVAGRDVPTLPPASIPAPTRPAAPPPPPRTIQVAGTAPAPPQGEISPSAHKILQAIHASFPVSLSYPAAAKRAGVSRRSSAYRRYRQEIEASPDIEVLDDGKYRSRLGNINGGFDPQETIADFTRRLPPSYAEMLRVIADQNGVPLDRDLIADLAGVSPTSSGLSAGLRELESLELIERQDAGYALSQDLVVHA